MSNDFNRCVLNVLAIAIIAISSKTLSTSVGTDEFHVIGNDSNLCVLTILVIDITDQQT
jgi:hypothetical protein